MARRPALYDGCPTAHALDVIGDRWALLIVRELLLGPKRFTDLRRGLPRISRNVLSQRLDDLEGAAVLVRRALPPPAPAAVYELTERGLELESVLQAIGRWGVRSPTLPRSDSLGTDTFVLGLRGHFDPARAAHRSASYELRVAEDVFAFDVARGRLTVRRGAPDAPDLVLEVDPARMASVARGDTPLKDAVTAAPGATRSDVDGFARLFRRPARRVLAAG